MSQVDACTNENDISVDARGLKRPGYTSEVDLLKKPKIDELAMESLSPSTSSGRVTPLTVASLSTANSIKKLTPKIPKEEREAQRALKALHKKLKEEERVRAKAEKEKIAEEKRLEKERKEKEKEEKRKEEEKKKEEKRKEEEERKERKRKEEEEKQKKKEEIAQKKREEEERKEAKRREEEALEEKKRRASARFIGFFNKVEKKKSEMADKTEDELWYKPFEVKDGMILAPIQRRPVLQLEDDILNQETNIRPNDYLSSLSANPRKLIGVSINPMRAKLYQFHDNYRPPYYGTWRSRSKAITGRRPFTTKDENIDYEVDSDAEWEEEPSDAEECKSDEEEDAGGDSDIDSEHEAFFVEPGYLSAGEGDEASDDDGDDRAANEDRDTEERRARLAARACEWRSRVLGRKQLAVLVPRCVGPIYSCANAPQTLAALRVVLF